MLDKLFKRLLIVVILSIPSLSTAAGAPPSEEPKPVAPRLSVGVPQLIAAENKSPEAAPPRLSAKVGYVDIVRIGSESERGKALKATLSAKKEQLQGKIDTRKKQIEKLKASIESTISTMSPQQREAKSKEFQKKLDDFQKFARTSEEELFTLQDKETRGLYDDIEKVSAAHGAANGFSVIVIKKELLYVGNAVDALDVTEALIKALNDTGKKK